MPEPDTYWVGKHHLPQRACGPAHSTIYHSYLRENISEKPPKGAKQKKNRHVLRWEIIFPVSF